MAENKPSVAPKAAENPENHHSKSTVAAEERVDYENEIHAIETRHRHDLAVHLYSTFLLHQVNPFYPPPQWASWPLPVAHCPDPRITIDAEDFVHNNMVYSSKRKIVMTHEDEKWLRRKPLAFVAKLNKSGKKVDINYKYRRIVDARTSLVNEMHFVLQKKIRELVKKRNLPDERIPLNGNSAMMEVLATRLANRLGNVLQVVANSKPRGWRVRDEVSKKHGKTWQDMVLASFSYDRLNGHADVASQKRLYLKMRRLFSNVSYDYVYDEEDEEEEDDDENDESNDNSNENDKEGSVKPSETYSEKDDPSAKSEVMPAGPEIEARLLLNAQNAEFKERVILGLMDQTVRAKQLSWDAHDNAMFGVYSPLGEYLHSERQRVFEKKGEEGED